MKTLILLLFGLAALVPAKFVRAGDDDSDLRVDVVVDLTNAGHKVSRPTPAHPAYYVPIVKGYTPAGAILADEHAPTDMWQIEHLLAVALAKQGYLLAEKATPPSLVLIFWWGYRAPEVHQNYPVSYGQAVAQAGGMGSGHGISSSSSIFGSPEAYVVQNLMNEGALPTKNLLNQNEMYELVLGSKFEPNTDQAIPSLRLETALQASWYARYYLMVSALDYKAAIEHKNYVVLWTARVSTELAGHNLDQVLPTLIADGAGMFGRDTNGPNFSDGPIVPEGRVFVGSPVLKASSSPAAASQQQ